MPLFTTKPTDQFFERFMKHQPNFKPDAPEADRIQAELDAEKERKEARPMIYRDERHQHTFEKEAAMRPESVSRPLLAALYLLTADRQSCGTRCGTTSASAGCMWTRCGPRTSPAPATSTSPPLRTS